MIKPLKTVGNFLLKVFYVNYEYQKRLFTGEEPDSFETFKEKLANDKKVV